MRRKLGTKGEIIIPKAIRDSLGLERGSALVLEVSGRRIVITPELAPGNQAAVSSPAPRESPRKLPRREVDWDALASSISPSR